MWRRRAWHAGHKDHSFVRVSNSEGIPFSVRYDGLVVADDQRRIYDEKADIGTIGTLKPPERCDFVPCYQTKTLAVIEANEAFLELNG